MIEQIILDLIADNEENFLIKDRNEYCVGYADDIMMRWLIYLII